jgi:hypothetical protein
MEDRKTLIIPTESGTNYVPNWCCLSKAYRIPEMNKSKTIALGEKTEVCWRTRRKSRFTIRGKLDSDSVEWIIRLHSHPSIGGLIVARSVSKWLETNFIWHSSKEHRSTRRAGRNFDPGSSQICFLIQGSFLFKAWSRWEFLTIRNKRVLYYFFVSLVMLC